MCREYNSGYLLGPKRWWKSGDGRIISNKDPCKETDKWTSLSGNHLWIRHVKDHQGNRIRKLNETMVDMAVRKIDRQRHVTQSVTANISAQQKT